LIQGGEKGTTTVSPGGLWGGGGYSRKRKRVPPFFSQGEGKKGAIHHESNPWSGERDSAFFTREGGGNR